MIKALPEQLLQSEALKQRSDRTTEHNNQLILHHQSLILLSLSCNPSNPALEQAKIERSTAIKTWNLFLRCTICKYEFTILKL